MPSGRNGAQGRPWEFGVEGRSAFRATPLRELPKVVMARATVHWGIAGRMLPEYLSFRARPCQSRTIGIIPRRRWDRLRARERSEEHTSELQSRLHLVCRLLPEQ